MVSHDHEKGSEEMKEPRVVVKDENEKDIIVEKKQQTLRFHKLLSYADAMDWTLMALGTLGSIVHGMAQPVGYMLLGKALDAFGNNINDSKAMSKAIFQVVPYVWYMAAATFPAGILEIGCWLYTSERQLSRLRLTFLKAVLNQEIGAFDTDLTNGKIITAVTSHMSVIQDAIGEKLGHFLSSFATFFSGVLIAGISSWEVALLSLFVVPIILVIGATYTKKMNIISAKKMVYLSQAASMVEQNISQIRTVFAFVGESSAIKCFSECMAKFVSLGKLQALIKGIGTGMFQSVTFCSWALIIYVGAVVVTAGRSTGGDVIAAVMSILFGAISLTYAAPDMQVFNQARAAGKEVFEIIERKSLTSSYNNNDLSPRERKHAATIDNVEIKGNIDIRGVHFAYPSRPETTILTDFFLFIPAGKMVALVGSSGCGKSTVISLVSRFYDPIKGEILIDNYNIGDMDLKFLRKNIGAVSQEPSLFGGSIKDNLKVGNMEADDQQIQSAAKMANAHSFISQLPDRYLTQVGQRGVQLSGGQKQRIAIARAILKNPPILLLDEATSALDSESEKLVQDALEKAMKGRTVILIAHRMSTILNADIIAVVENGQVTDTGTHHSLLETNKFYYNLFSMQNLSTDSSEIVPDSTSTNKQPLPLQVIEQQDKDREPTPFASSTNKEGEQKTGMVIKKSAIFFRLWFGLHKGELVKTVIGAIAAAFSGISKPVFGYYIITVGVAYFHPNAKHEVGKYSIIFFLVGLLSMLTNTLQHYFFGVVGEKATANLRQALYSVYHLNTPICFPNSLTHTYTHYSWPAGVLRNELGWFDKPENSVGSLTSRIIHDTSVVKTIISDRMSVIVQCISSILIATVVSMYVDWTMGLVAWAVMPCHFIGGLIQAKSAKGFSGDSAAAHQEVVALTSESVANIRTIASFCYEEHILRRAKLCLEGPRKKSRWASVKYGLIQGVSLCLWNIAHAVALTYSAIQISHQTATFKNSIRSYQIFSLTVPSITELWTLIPAVISAISVLTPAFETLDRETEIPPDAPDGSASDRRITGSVEFQNVNFKYPLRPEVTVLNDFSLQIEPGFKLALVGPSGSGKSSVLALLLRFYDPEQGRVLIDGKNIKEYNLRNLRTQIGFVQQEPLLFSSSIRDNIRYGNEMASELEIVKVSMEANIHQFVSNLPDGYDTVVGEKGCQLSGGQKQRIAIARTLLKRPAILLLDEATSALDAESERSIVNALESLNSDSKGSLMYNTTQITVAHRLSTVKNSNIIVVMDKGKIVEIGSHSTLIASSEGMYSKLYQLQSLTES